MSTWVGYETQYRLYIRSVQNMYGHWPIDSWMTFEESDSAKLTSSLRLTGIREIYIGTI